MVSNSSNFCSFFFNDTATTEIYTLSLHDALPISTSGDAVLHGVADRARAIGDAELDRKSTRLNSSHTVISYAVFCLKKQNTAYTAFVRTCASFVHRSTAKWHRR